MTRPRVVIDCDPGHDDAVAILVAAQRAELVGVTTVSGNAPLELTTRNALLTCQIAGIDVPVHAGADRPLVETPRHAHAVHGTTGLDGPTLPALRRQVAGHDAVAYLLDVSRQVRDLWLVAVGPLTNVALALRSDPTLASRLAGISLMGGAVAVGNRTAVAEFNIWADPEAAAVVFGSGVVLRMCGLDVTRHFTVDDDVIARLRMDGSDVSRFVADLFDFYCQAYLRSSGLRSSGRRVAALHDPCAVLSLTDPDLFTAEDLHVAVELAGTLTRGMTVADRRGQVDGPSANTKVMMGVDRDAAMDVVIDAIRACGDRSGPAVPTRESADPPPTRESADPPPSSSTVAGGPPAEPPLPSDFVAHSDGATVDGAGTDPTAAERKPEGRPVGDAAHWHRRFAAESFNQSWDLLERADRDADADAALLTAAFASRWHWGHVGSADNQGLADHQVAKVAAALGLAELSMQYAKRALQLSETEGWTGWQRAICLEGMARAAHAAGDGDALEDWLARAAAALDEVVDPDDREVVESQLRELPGWPPPAAN